MDFEAPEADAAEQARVEDVEPGEDQPADDRLADEGLTGGRPAGATEPFAEVDPADLADQQRVVPDEEDLYDR